MKLLDRYILISYLKKFFSFFLLIMFVFIFQFLSYQPGDENISIENNTITNTYNIPMNNLKGDLLKITDILGRKTKINKNQPLFYIYDDGTVEKKITIDKQ